MKQLNFYSGKFPGILSDILSCASALNFNALGMYLSSLTVFRRSNEGEIHVLAL